MIKKPQPVPVASPAPQAVEEETEPVAGSGNLIKDLIVSIATQAWLASMVIHMTLFIILALVLGTIHVAATIGAAPAFEVIEEPESLEPEISHFEVGYTPPDPTELSTETLTMAEAPTVEAQFNDNSPVFSEAGGGIVGGESNLPGLGSFNVIASGLGPAVKGAGGVAAGAGFGKNMGTGGAGSGFGSRGTGMREAMLGTGGTKQSERAVAAALNWIARHQSPDGHWNPNHPTIVRQGLWPGARSGRPSRQPPATLRRGRWRPPGRRGQRPWDRSPSSRSRPTCSSSRSPTHRRSRRRSPRSRATFSPAGSSS